MNAVKKWFSAKISSIKNYWNNNNQQLKLNIRRLDRYFERLAKGITRLMIIGIIINVVSSYFYPEFPERFPTIYGWFDGWLQLAEFAIKFALSGIYSLFTGHWSEFLKNSNEALNGLLQQFTNWLATLHF